MYKILLCCASGITTNMLVNSMKEAAKKEDISAMIWSVGETALNLSWADADCVLIVPQKNDLLKQVKEMVNGTIPVETIDDNCFVTMNGKAVLDNAIALIKG